MKPADYWWMTLPMNIIEAQAAQRALDPALIAAICWKESAGKQFSCRYEPEFKYFYEVDDIAKQLCTSRGSVAGLQATSWGLMHVMGARAYELGLAHNRFPSELCMAQVGIEYGCRHLESIVKNKKYANLDEIICAYNRGSVKLDSETKRFTNQEYVDAVLTLMANFRNKGK